MEVSPKRTEPAPAAAAFVRGGPVVDRRITEELVAFCTGLTPTSLPAATLVAARRLALDFAGVALRGSLEASSKAAANAVARLSPSSADGCTMIGHSRRAFPQYAAFSNGISVHGLELDDIHPEAGVHVGATIFAAAFAMAERVGATGADLFAAAVAGYEVSCRTGLALPLPEHSAHGFHSTGTCGVFGAAMTASRLLGLTTEQTLNALGIAGSQAAGSLEYRTERADTKRFHPGWAAHCGVVAAELARTGFTGPHRILEGRAGFLRSYSDNPRPDVALAGLGEEYHILRTAIKPHAACRYSQGTIDAMLSLVRQYDLQPAAIEHITIGLFKGAFASVVEPQEPKRRPRMMADAQFSAVFAAAAVALWRQVTMAEYEPDRLFSPELHAMIDRVDCIEAPELNELFPKLWPAKIEIALKDGRKLNARVDRLKGDPDNALSWDELVAKFDGLAAALLTAERRTEIVAIAKDIENRPASDFVRLLATG
jgi:2-methylcitrate dehydratase PrpD